MPPTGVGEVRVGLLGVDWSPTGVGEGGFAGSRPCHLPVWVRVDLLGVDWSPTRVGEGGFAESRYATYRCG